jgi:hypothetical protein
MDALHLFLNKEVKALFEDGAFFNRSGNPARFSAAAACQPLSAGMNDSRSEAEALTYSETRKGNPV